MRNNNSTAGGAPVTDRLSFLPLPSIPILPPDASPMNVSSQRKRFLLVVIFAIAAFFRFYALPSTPPGLYRDEGMDGCDALAALETHHFDVFYPLDHGREGLYVNLAALCIACFGNHTWVLRLPAAIFGFLTVSGLYVLASELFSVPVGLLAAFFAATSAWHINFSRIAFRAIAGPFFLVWCLYLLLLAARKQHEQKHFLSLVALAGVTYGLGFYTYIAYRATFLLIGVAMLYYFLLSRSKKMQRNFLRTVVTFLVAALLVITPLALYFVRHPGTFSGRMAKVSIFNTPHPLKSVAVNVVRTALMFYTRGDRNWRSNYSGRPEVYWPVAAFMTLGLFLAIARSCSREEGSRRWSYLVVLTWLLVGALPVVASDPDAVPHALRTILMVPPVFMLAAVGAWTVYSRLRLVVPNPALPVAATAVLLALTFEPAYTYFVRWARDPAVPPYFDVEQADLARGINTYSRDLPKVVALPYLNRKHLPLRVASLMYLTKTYTPREQAEAHIQYVTPDTFEIPIPDDLRALPFCEQVVTLTPNATVFCVDFQ